MTSTDAQGRVERAIARLYRRVGSRINMLCIVVGVVVGLITAGATVAFGSRYLDLSTAQAVKLAALAVPVALLLIALGLVPSRRYLRTNFSWGTRGAHDPVRTWYSIVGSAVIVRRVAICVSPLMPAATAYAIAEFHKSWWFFAPCTVGLLLALACCAMLVLFLVELLLRPMLEDVARHLPEDFEPKAQAIGLQVRALAPLPLVTLFAAIIVGAYANLSRNGALRYTLTLAVALVVVAIATMIFMIISRSVLAPINDLIVATKRVRGGDLDTRVPILGADELATLGVGFNEMLAALRAHTEELRSSRERIVTAADSERRRVERDLHDGAQQQLVLAQLKLGTLANAIQDTPQATTLAAELRADLDRALAELRELAHGLYPAVLETDGLPGALQDAAQRAALPTTVDCNGAKRYPPELETAIYFCCLEALQNAGKHAGPGAHATIRLRQADNTLNFQITDTGNGFDPTTSPTGHGLQNMTDRIGALGGKLKLESAPGRGTVVTGQIQVGKS